jgi:hypothetical protein
MKTFAAIVVLAVAVLAAVAVAGDVRVEQINAVDAGACSSRLRHNVKYAISCEPTVYVRLTHSDAGIPSRGDVVIPPEKLYDFDTSLEERYICVRSPDAGAARGCSIFERRICKGC